ncbi:MAG: C25 family cysteine peptidase [Bacteroidota bacterium]|nr:C25 family cysteine peptidase [Bacteroidota bacterium]
MRKINQLAQHRAYYNGFDVGIVKIENILSLPFQFDDQEYQDEQKLRSFLKEVFDAENANHTYDGKLGYVILVGDHDDVPTSYDQNPGKTFNDEPYPSDYYFTCLTSENGMYDEIGEFFIGRLSIQNSTELDNFINKITYFENEYSAGQWRNNVGHAFGGGMATGYPQIYNEFVEGLFPNDDYELKSAKYPNLQNELLANINNGLPYLMLFGHGSRTSWEVITSSEFQTYLTNVNKTPVALGYSCKTGEFDSPYEQCLAEVLTTYSATKGMAGYLGAGLEIWSSSGTTYDLPLYHREYSPNNILQNLSHICGEFIYESNVNSFDVSYPFALNYFGDPAMNIMATGYEVTTNLAIPDETVISSVIYVRDGATVTISPYSNIYFESNGKLIIEDGGKLNLYGGSTIHGLNENNAIVIQGDLNSGNTISSVTFTSTESNEWTGLVFEDETSDYGVNSCVFENCGVSGYAHNLDVDNTDFDNAFIEYSAGKLDVNGCDFTDSYIYAFDGTLVLPVQVINSTFNNTANNNYPIKIDNYRLFDIHGNDIKHNDKTGIAIYNSKGTRGAVIQDIYDNTIYSKTAGSGSTDFGIRVYNSHADIIDDNYIYNNYVGVVSYNTSEVNIVGDCNAANEAEAQRIKDNSLRQVYTDENSFPTDFMYNVIYDANANTYYVYYDRGFVGYPDTDIRDNYWGTGFVPGNNLYPAVCFIYSPTWNFGCTKNGSVESKYDSAVQFIVSQDYLTAETLFKEIVVDSPDSKYAKASIKQLFSLKELYDNDYESLKSFYDTTSVLQDTTDIAKLADWLSNKCDVKLQNYQTAINWYEDIIENPESENDSTFAIIDLGYLYLIMEDTSQRQGMACRFPQYRFSDRVNYTKYRDKLLDNLYCGETTTGINEPELNNLNAISNISISPNPVFTQVNIDLSSKEQGLLNIEIYDMSGRLILKSNDHTINKGSNSLFIDLSDHPKGVYNCTFNLNNNSTLTKKIIKL